ncbi:MAG TPA: helix-turn-helix transcriptional regulator [Solirubrobacterales bacterium]|jgi:transcriptional regulator with XRE-family HTH domain|nr:helix-turn-helix transcriptional regulator [Solirubrobacterales bacterium]
MPPQRRVKPRSAELAALGEAVEQMRRKAGLSQEDLADAAGLHITHLGGIERGTRNPSYTTLLKLTTALNIRIGALTALADCAYDRAR